MKKISLLLVALTILWMPIFAQKGENRYTKTSKIVVVYFSATGNTARVAKTLAGVVGGELHEIVPQTPYTSADLDWRNKQSRSSLEMGDPQSRPAIKAKKENIAGYEVIFIGYPIWWNLAPVIVNTFIESHNLDGKTVVPFATSGSSSIDNSVEQLKKAYPGIVWKEGKLLTRANEQTMREWVEQEIFQ